MTETLTTTETIERTETFDPGEGSRVEETRTVETEVPAPEPAPVDQTVLIDGLREELALLREDVSALMAQMGEMTRLMSEEVTPQEPPAPAAPAPEPATPAAPAAPAAPATPAGQTVIKEAPDQKKESSDDKPKRKHAGVIW